MKISFYLKKFRDTITFSKRAKKNARLLQELDWANVFNSTISDSPWLEDKSFSPGRYAIGYPFLYVLYRILDSLKPAAIIEFGLGQSTNMLHRYAASFSHASIKTFEHNTDWIAFFRQNMKIPSNAEIIQVESFRTKYKGSSTVSIRGHEEVINGRKYTLIILDAPSTSKRYARPQILPMIPDNIDKDNFCILIDDYNRHGEQETCDEMEKLFKMHDIAYCKTIYSGIKDFALYCSPGLVFLTTL